MLVFVAASAVENLWRAARRGFDPVRTEIFEDIVNHAGHEAPKLYEARHLDDAIKIVMSETGEMIEAETKRSDAYAGTGLAARVAERRLRRRYPALFTARDLCVKLQDATREEGVAAWRRTLWSKPGF